MSCTWFVHIWTVYLWNELYIYCQSLPRPMYIFSHASDSQSIMCTCYLITLIAFQLHMAVYMPEKLWLISHLFYMVLAEVPSSTWRDLAFSIFRCSKLTRAFFCLPSLPTSHWGLVRIQLAAFGKGEYTHMVSLFIKINILGILWELPNILLFRQTVGAYCFGYHRRYWWTYIIMKEALI